MFGRVAPLAALALLSFPLVTAAGDLKPVPKTGACPPGYYSSGNYCVPNKSAKPVIGKDGPCPPGYYSSGNYCLGRSDSKTVIEKLGPCPPGYYSSGNYCMKSKYTPWVVPLSLGFTMKSVVVIASMGYFKRSNHVDER